jgi:uncharacterized repeat protein (TIGR01451 family)
MAASSVSAWAADTSPPTLTASHTWIQKEGNFYRFNILLDPRDDQGIERLEVREKINATSIPDSMSWREAVQDGVGSSEVPWKPEEPLSLAFNCTSMILQVRAVDTSGNYSEVITRTYKSPFPLSAGPNLTPSFGATALEWSGAGNLDCRGLFSADFDGNGRDDLAILNRTSGLVKIRRQNMDGSFSSNAFTVTANSITDGTVADFNGDGQPDIAVVVDGSVTVYENEGTDQNDVLQFTPTTPGGLADSAMAVVRHIAAVDLTGEGKPEIIISGDGDGNLGGGGANVAVLLNDESYALDAASNAVAPDGASAGRLALADFDGDGHLDVAMLNEAQKQVLLFRNKGNSSFGAATEADATLRPVTLHTGALGQGAATTAPGLPLAPRSLAAGDVTGDGRPDIVVTIHGYLGTGATAPVYRNLELWQLIENRGGGNFERWADQLVSQSEAAHSELDFASDVLLRDLNGDRLPELIFTSQFENGIRAFRFMPWLNRDNQLHTFTTSPTVVTSAANPHRLAAARFGANTKFDIVVANEAVKELTWHFTTSSSAASTKPIDVVGGAATVSCPGGIQGVNGTVSYVEYPGGTITYTLNCFNNTTTDLAGVTLEIPLPKGLYMTSGDAGYTYSYSGGAYTIRWNLDIPAGTSTARTLTAYISGIKAGSTIAPKAALKQGTKGLAAAVMPAVKVLAPDLHVFPSSFGQTWTFSFRPVYNPPAGAGMWMQGSFNGYQWFYLNAGSMTRASQFALEWNLATSSVPYGCRYFRTAIVSPGADAGYSSVFSAFLPATTGLKIVTKSPPSSGNFWTFSAAQTSTASNLTVRFQSTTTPDQEGSWTDIPVYSAVTRQGSVWNCTTYNIPAGVRYFRAISAAPGWVDSISAPLGPFIVQQSPPHLPPFTHWHIDGVQPAQGGQGEYAHQGDTVVFSASTAAVPGIKVRFQSKPHSNPEESAWTDLQGVMKVSGTKWTFTASYLPVGFRDFRAISSAPGYTDNTTLLYKGNYYSTVFAFLIKEPRLPQIPTIFSLLENPRDGSVVRTGIDIPISLKLFDFNGVQRAFVQQAQPGGTFKEIPNSNLMDVGELDHTTNLRFSGVGQISLRVAVVDGFFPSQTCYSNEITITVGPGNGGTSGPAITGFNGTLTQATLKSRGSVNLKARIGDDAGVRHAYVHNMTAGGAYVSTVGQMTRASNSNPADFACVASNLSDGTYYYRIVAEDFDGNESISGLLGPFEIVTPPVPPTPIHLHIADSSKLVMPTLPSGKFNYAYIPYATSGMVEFSYSGLPAGTNRFVAYRLDLGPNAPFWEQTVTNTSGTLKIKAPWWRAEKSYPNAGEGDYRIVCFQGSSQLPHGSGRNSFTVGHGWNLPNTFTELDYGLYWFKDGYHGLRGISPDQSDEYFDASKPTVIYVHGWQPGEVKVRRRESWVRQDPYQDSKVYDMCKVWKKQGYNVGIFNWNQFGDGDLLFSQANIYYIATENGLPAGHSLIYSKRNSDGSSSRHYFAYGHREDLDDRDVAELFINELFRCIGGYTPSASKEFRLIGHSLGTQVVGRTCDLIRQNPDWGIPLPTRISLLELAQINGLSINGLDIPETQKGYIAGLKNKGIAIDCYQSTDLQSLLGVNLAFVGDLHDMCAYARWRPDFIEPLKVGHNVFQKSHNEIVRWYMQSFDYYESAFPAFTYRAPFLKGDAVGNALSASTSNTRVKGLMGGMYWYEQSEGKNTAAITDDEFERKNR